MFLKEKIIYYMMYNNTFVHSFFYSFILQTFIVQKYVQNIMLDTPCEMKCLEKGNSRISLYYGTFLKIQLMKWFQIF